MLKSIFRQERGSRDGDDASKLLQTLSDSFSVEERRESSLGLKNALLDNSSSKSSVSSFGLEIICNAIRNDWKDEEVVRNCLESLAIIVDTSYSENIAESRVNAEQLARTPGALSLLFDSLEYSMGSGSESFHIKYFGLQVLKNIFDANQGFCQQALNVPNSLSAPVKLLDDQEVLRNDSILLLQSLIYGSKVAQDAAMRAGCLEKLYSIYEGEDPHLNYAVIEDSMNLLRYILDSNLDAQAIFSSTDHFERLLKNFQTRVSHASPHISLEQSRILSSELSIFFAFFASRSLPNLLKPFLERRDGEATPLLIKWLLSLVQIQGDLDDFAFSSAAWDCLLEVSKFPTIGEYVLKSQISIQGQSAPIQLGSLFIALTSRDVIHQMSSMRFCVRMLWKDDLMQSHCVKQLFSSSNAGALLFGETKTLIDLLLRSRCLMCLAPLSMKKVNRDKLQSIQSNGKHLVSLCSEILSKAILQFGRVPEASEICLNCSIFAACIAQDSPETITRFLQCISEKPFLVGVLLSESQFGDNEGIIKGVCSLVLGICLEAPASTVIDPRMLEATIKDKIGLSTYVAHLNYLQGQTSQFDQDYLFNGIIPIEIFTTLIDRIKSRFYPNTIQTFGESITKQSRPLDENERSEMSKPDDLETSSISKISEISKLQKDNTNLKTELQWHKEELATVREKLRKTEEDLEALSHAYSALDEHSNNLNKEIESLKNSDRSNDLDESAIEDLLVCLGQEEEKNARLVAQLEALGIPVE